MRPVRRPGQAAVSRRRLAAGLVLACTVILAVVRACGDSPGTGGLVADVDQKGMANCTPAPLPRSAITTWHSPVWFALDMFVNTSRSPLTVESVSLIDPHNVSLRGALVYEMVHSRFPLLQTGGLADLAASVPAAYWARKQFVPGAVIAAGDPVQSFAPSPSHNVFEIVPAVEQRHPGGGWALGEIVTYRAGGKTYTVTAYTGYIISPSLSQNACQPLDNAVFAAFKA
jgi:hypothetical protein